MTENLDTKALEALRRAAELEAEKNKKEGSADGRSAVEIASAGQQGSEAVQKED